MCTWWSCLVSSVQCSEYMLYKFSQLTYTFEMVTWLVHTPSLCQGHLDTITLSLSLCHCYSITVVFQCNSVTVTLSVSLCHCHYVIITIRLSLVTVFQSLFLYSFSHCQFNFVTVILSLSLCYCHSVTGTLSLSKSHLGSLRKPWWCPSAVSLTLHKNLGAVFILHAKLAQSLQEFLLK